MSEEPNNIEDAELEEAVESAAAAGADASAEESAASAGADATAESSDSTSSTDEPVAAEVDDDTELEPGPVDPDPETEAPAEKPKRSRAAKPKAEKAEEKRSGKSAAAPRRSRAAREPGAPRPVVRAQAKYVRSSARKARLVCDNIRGKSVDEARAILAHTPRAVARDWSKLLESAIANAEHNHELVGEDLYVKAITADEGPTIKRFRPRAQGRATRIRKRTAHLTILLTPKD